MKRLTTATLLLGALLITGHAHADCAGGTRQEAKEAYERGKKLESDGRKEAALFAYHAAQGSVCEGANPYDSDAAKRAAPLGLELGTAAEKRGDLDKARELYDTGGHFAAGDRVVMQKLRANPGHPGLWESASAHFENRPILSHNRPSAAKAAGNAAYSPDPKLIAELNAMPPRGVELTLQREAASFKEQYLQDLVKLEQSRPDEITEPNALERAAAAEQAFAQKWKEEDPMKNSRDALNTLVGWGRIHRVDPQVRNTANARAEQLAEQRATFLRQKYSGSPKALEEARKFYGVFTDIHGSDSPKAAKEIAALRAQAMKLGDDADAKKRWSLAIGYYKAADARDKADAVQKKRDQLAMQKMQPAIDEAQKQAAAMQKQFSDPAQVEAMRQQAEAARKAMEAQKADAKANKAKNRKAADDLEKELGL